MKGSAASVKNKKSSGKSAFSGIIIGAVAAVLVLGILIALIFGPSLAARPVFKKSLGALKTSDGSVILCDPYSTGGLLPSATEVTLSDEDGRALVSALLSAFDSYRYVETRALGGTKLWPYICVTGGSVTYLYLEEDSVWVEKNSTFYRFRPGDPDGEAAYAELYRDVTERLSE